MWGVGRVAGKGGRDINGVSVGLVISHTARMVSGEKFIAEPFGTRCALQSCHILCVQTARRQNDHRDLISTNIKALQPLLPGRLPVSHLSPIHESNLPRQ